MPERSKNVHTIQIEIGAIRIMIMPVGPVQGASACTAEIGDKGQEVVFDNDGGFILENVSGENILMHKKGTKTYSFTVKGLKLGAKAKACESTDVVGAVPGHAKTKVLAPLVRLDFPRQVV